MTASPDGWRFGPLEWFQQQDRDNLRDRVKDCEHTLEDHAKLISNGQKKQSETDTRVAWQTAAIGLLAWAFLNTKLAVWTPEVAHIVATVLKGFLR